MTLKLSLEEAQRLTSVLKQSTNRSTATIRRISPGKRCNIIATYLKCKSITETAKQTHSGNQTVRRVLQQAKIYP